MRRILLATLAVALSATLAAAQFLSPDSRARPRNHGQMGAKGSLSPTVLYLPGLHGALYNSNPTAFAIRPLPVPNQNTAAYGFGFDDANNVVFEFNTTVPLAILSSGPLLGSGSLIGWNSAALVAGAAPDTTLCRQAAGIVEANSGSGCGATGGFQARQYVGTGSVPSNSGSCAIQTQLGGNTIGSFVANGACAAGTVVFTFAYTASNGWSCDMHDLTTTGDAMNQTAYTTTTATFTGTMAGSDLVTFKCFAF